MRLGNLALAAAALAATAVADAMVTMTGCNTFWVCGFNKAVWYTDFGAFSVNANEGCWNPGVPNINWFCVDRGNKRLHFDANGQPRRCLK